MRLGLLLCFYIPQRYIECLRTNQGDQSMGDKNSAEIHGGHGEELMMTETCSGQCFMNRQNRRDDRTVADTVMFR